MPHTHIGEVKHTLGTRIKADKDAEKASTSTYTRGNRTTVEGDA